MNEDADAPLLCVLPVTRHCFSSIGSTLEGRKRDSCSRGVLNFLCGRQVLRHGGCFLFCAETNTSFLHVLANIMPKHMHHLCPHVFLVSSLSAPPLPRCCSLHLQSHSNWEICWTSAPRFAQHAFFFHITLFSYCISPHSHNFVSLQRVSIASLIVLLSSDSLTSLPLDRLVFFFPVTFFCYLFRSAPRGAPNFSFPSPFGQVF